MGLSLHSALMIQNNETLVDTYSNKEKTGYGFIIYMLKRGEIHTKIVSTIPHLPYKTSEEAKKNGEDIIETVKGIDLTPQISGLQKIIDSNDGKVVSEVIRGTKDI